MKTWYCKVCRHDVTAVPYTADFRPGGHDEAPHEAYRHRNNRIIWTGIGLVLLGQVLVVLGKFLGIA